MRSSLRVLALTWPDIPTSIEKNFAFVREVYHNVVLWNSLTDKINELVRSSPVENEPNPASNPNSPKLVKSPASSPFVPRSSSFASLFGALHSNNNASTNPANSPLIKKIYGRVPVGLLSYTCAIDERGDLVLELVIKEQKNVESVLQLLQQNQGLLDFLGGPSWKYTVLRQ